MKNNHQNQDKKGSTINETESTMAENMDVETLSEASQETNTTKSSVGNNVSNDDLVKDLETKLSQAESRIRSLIAEFDNFRKQKEAEKAKYALTGNMMLVSEIISVVDDITMSSQDANLDLTAAKQMLDSNRNKLLNAIKLTGLSIIDVNKGDKFDPTKMEAIAAIPGDEQNKGTIAEIVTSGFIHNTTAEILKTAKVVVFK